MSESIIEQARNNLDSDFVSQLAIRLGESESGISKAMNSLLVFILKKIQNHKNEKELYHQLYSYNQIYKPLDLLEGEKDEFTQGLSQLLFPNDVNKIMEEVSGFSKITDKSCEKLLRVVVLTLGKTFNESIINQHIDISSFSSFIKDQASFIPYFIDKHLNFGVFSPKFDALIESLPKKSIPNPTKEPTKNHRNVLIKWFLPLMVLSLSAWFLMKEYKNEMEAEKKPKKQTVHTTLKGEKILLKKDTIHVENGKMEKELIAFLSTEEYQKATDASLKQKWFNFDNLNFKSETSDELNKSSEVQILNLSKVLKAYPEIKVKIAVFMPKTEDEQQNKKRSQERADFIKQKLEHLGVGEQVVHAEGYGSKFAQIPLTKTKEERSKDYRIAIRFTK